MNYIFLFETTERDRMNVYCDNEGNFYQKRYGLPILPLDKKYVRTIAWLEANRRGWFSHLIREVEGSNIPTLVNPEAQNYVVDNMLKCGSRFPANLIH